MSGGWKTGTSKKKNIHLPKRPDLLKPGPDVKPISNEATLPTRPYLHVTIKVLRLKPPIARVKRKGWIRPGKWPTLWWEISEYITKIKNYTSIVKYQTTTQKQALQMCLHEMMHLALWDDTTISHSADPDSMLHYYVEGKTLVPNNWDLAQMKNAAKRIGLIKLDLGNIKLDTPIRLSVITAVNQWNNWIGREFFRIE